ncbi:hypothetical protein D3C85_1902830 [compost metagenome]
MASTLPEKSWVTTCFLSAVSTMGLERNSTSSLFSARTWEKLESSASTWSRVPWAEATWNRASA